MVYMAKWCLYDATNIKLKCVDSTIYQSNLFQQGLALSKVTNSDIWISTMNALAFEKLAIHKE
jgi:hypothetical protein